MSPPPAPGRRRTPWQAFARTPTRRLEVEGGVRVARPGAVTGAEAQLLVELVEHRTTAGIGSRGRTYARAGQVVEVRIADRSASAAIQGTDVDPYAVGLYRLGPDDVEADCSCPYGCDEIEWCKHAAALAYVVAALVDTDPSLAAAWSGEAVPGSAASASSSDGEGATVAAAGVPDAPALAVRDQLRAALAGGPVEVDAAAQWAAAQAVLPPVWRPL